MIPCEWCNKGIPPEYLQTHQVKTYDVIVLSYPHIICSYNSVQSYQVKTKHFYHPMLQTYPLLLLLTLLIIMTSLQLGKVCSGSCDVTCFILTLLGTYSVVHCQYCSARIPSDQYHKHLVCCMCNHVVVVLCVCVFVCMCVYVYKCVYLLRILHTHGWQYCSIVWSVVFIMAMSTKFSSYYNIIWCIERHKNNGYIVDPLSG